MTKTANGHYDGDYVAPPQPQNILKNTAEASASLYDNASPEFAYVKDFVRPEGMTGEQVQASVRCIEGWLEGPDYSALEFAFCLFRIFRDDTSGQ
jgi:hypothetical protein